MSRLLCSELEQEKAAPMFVQLVILLGVFCTDIDATSQPLETEYGAKVVAYTGHGHLEIELHFVDPDGTSESFSAEIVRQQGQIVAVKYLDKNGQWIEHEVTLRVAKQLGELAERVNNPQEAYQEPPGRFALIVGVLLIICFGWLFRQSRTISKREAR